MNPTTLVSVNRSSHRRFGLSAPSRRARLALGFVLAACLGAGCETIAGVDFGKARPGDFDPPGTLPDGAPIDPNGSGDGGSPISSCTPEGNALVCADRCGPTEDNCKTSRGCAGDCGFGKTCTSGKCECVSEGRWCQNRCGQTQDNCTRPVSCGDCDGGIPCTDNACGCTPQPAGEACAGKSCGTETNNCGQIVACGTGGACTVGGAVCLDGGACCVDDGVACGGRCGGATVTNNCGQTVGCPVQCPAGQVCVGGSNTCCTPQSIESLCAGVACGPKTDNCGVTRDCPNTCGAPNTCGGGGAGPNGCGCTVTSNNCGAKCSGPGTNNCGGAVTCFRNCDVICGCNGGACLSTTNLCRCNGGTICR
jgi:hypothetical protein